MADLKMSTAPLNDSVIAALSRLVDDLQVSGVSRQPTHSQIGEQIIRAGLGLADPTNGGKSVGKAKRVRAVLHWAIDNAPEAGERFVYLMVSLIRGVGGFRSDSPNFVGGEQVRDIQDAFQAEGYRLAESGELLPVVLDNLSDLELTEALKAYVRRARKGVLDAALVTGTSKDLVEAVAAHVLTRRFGVDPGTLNFPTLLGQAFVAVGLCAQKQNVMTPQQQLDLALYELACAVNRLRNKQGTGHGRPFEPSVTQPQARLAVQSMGLVAERLLEGLK